MNVIAYIGEIIDKRLKVLDSLHDTRIHIFDDAIDLVEKLNGIAIDIFITNDVCICDMVSGTKMYQNTPILKIYSSFKDVDGICKSDLVINKKTTNIEFEKQLCVLLKLKLKNDENIKDEILHGLELKDSYIKVNQIYDTMREGIIITNEIGQITTINKTAKLICDYTNGNLKHIDDILNIYVNDIKIKIFIDTINSNYKITLNSATKLYTSIGKFIQVSLKSSKLKNNKGELIGILVIFQNISKEHQILTRLKDSEENYKRIYNNAPDIIYTHDVDGVFTSINRSSDFGYSISEVVGHNISEFMDNGNLETARENILQKINNDNKSTEYEINVMHKLGYPIRLEIKSILNQNKYGEYEIFSTARDITDKVDSRNQLKLEQERYKQMFFNTKSSIIVFKYIDDGFQIIDFNNKGELIDIIDSDNLKFRNILLFGDVFGKLYKFLVDVFNDKRENHRVDEFKIEMDGDDVYLNLFIYKLKHNNEIVMIYDNVTELKLLLNQYEEAKNKAKESDHLKSMFLSNMSHEIRTPMNSIKGFSAQLIENIDDDEKRRTYASYIHVSTDALLTILNDILEISMIENGTIILNNDYFIINSLFDELKKESFAMLREKNKSYILLNIIEPSESLEICSDMRRVKQILLNIIDNSIKFTEKGIIEIKCELLDDYVSFSIRDTGIGIRNEDMTKIFDRFYKVNTKKLNAGTGLGLSISKQLTDILGGGITVVSTIGKGTLVTVNIPIYTEKTITPNTQIQIKYDWSNKKILIVEDKAVNFRLLEMYLEHTHADIKRAEDGKAFFDIIDNGFDLILLDVQLPDTNGFVLLEWLRDNNYGVPVIIQTAYASVEDEEKSTQLRADGFLTKPIKKNQLIEMVSKKLN